MKRKKFKRFLIFVFIVLLVFAGGAVWRWGFPENCPGIIARAYDGGYELAKKLSSSSKKPSRKKTLSNQPSVDNRNLPSPKTTKGKSTSSKGRFQSQQTPRSLSRGGTSKKIEIRNGPGQGYKLNYSLNVRQCPYWELIRTVDGWDEVVFILADDYWYEVTYEDIAGNIKKGYAPKNEGDRSLGRGISVQIWWGPLCEGEYDPREMGVVTAVAREVLKKRKGWARSGG